MNVYSIILILYVCLILFALVVEGYKMAISSSWITWITVIVLLIALITASIYGYQNYNVSGEGDDANNNITFSDNDDDEEEEEDIHEPVDTDDLELNTRSFDIEKNSKGTTSATTTTATINDSFSYNDFKLLVSDATFLLNFTDAIKECLEMKRRKYINLLKQAQKELDTFNKSSGDFLTSALQKMRNEQLNDIQDLITRIKKIYHKINSRLQNCSVADTKSRLHSALYKKNVGLEHITGRQDIKDFLALRLYTFSKNPKVFFKSFQNIILMAPPGAGKTRIATSMAHVFACSGILVEDNVIITTKAGLISPYVSETAHKTHSFMLNTLESLIFFDEAYDFVQPMTLLGRHDHGQEAITQLVNDMDKMIGLHVVIAAGYETEMKERFITSNEGIPRRFPHQIVLEPYSAKDLTAILINTLRNTNPQLEWNKDMDNYVYTLIHGTYTKDESIFKNQAGDMVNLSSDISHTIYGSKLNWAMDYEIIILRGLNHYLETKGQHAVEK